MSERLSSGHPRLDGVLGGGLPANAINMLIGLPGTGKTILAQQFVFANATPERPVLYLATVSEPFDKILRYGQTLRFFDPEASGPIDFMMQRSTSDMDTFMPVAHGPSANEFKSTNESPPKVARAEN